MSRKKQLRFGETPFHKMTKKQLLIVACQMYAALSRTRSHVAMRKAADEYNGNIGGYWGENGQGGIALAMAEQALYAAQAGYTSEAVYRSFFRYATDLLFDNSKYKIGSGWMVCPVCGTMLGARGDGTTVEGQICKDAFPIQKGECPGVYRPLTWDDLREPFP